MKVNEKLLRTTDDATVWANEFKKVCPEVDEELMIGWFANCAQTALDLATPPENHPVVPGVVYSGDFWRGWKACRDAIIATAEEETDAL